MLTEGVGGDIEVQCGQCRLEQAAHDTEHTNDEGPGGGGTATVAGCSFRT